MFVAFAGLPGTAAGDEAEFKGLSEWNIKVTKGAAAGYVADETCALCHDDKAQSFRHVGMARSFYRPSVSTVVEDFDNNRFYHAPSDRRYEMELRDGEYWFRRYKIAADGARINEFEQKVDWILGSGNHTRVYLYQTADGALFQLPLAWYSQERKWQMAPGFEWERHLGVMRAVRRQCMFCHNAYPQVVAGSDRYGLPEIFPVDLPQGIGCQRCHGPGARHADLALSGEAEIAVIRGAIVNPAKLPPRLRYSICYGCHMQPAVAVTGVRRFGRNAYSFRPGEVLSQFRSDMDMIDPTRPKTDRFEINHHPYRLEQSACFIQSEGRLGCLTCHDPHRKIPANERPAHYRKACLGCHDLDEGGLPVMKTTEVRHPPVTREADCTSCHMPLRRTQDVVHATMTDHRIIRDPGPSDLIAPMEKKEARIDSIHLADRDHGLGPDEAVMMKAIAVLRTTNGLAGEATERLNGILRSHSSQHFEPWYELADALIKQKRFSTALMAINEAMKRTGYHERLIELKAVALFTSGDQQAGTALMEKLVSRPRQTGPMLHRLALMYEASGRREEARKMARAALELRHNHWPSWWLLGEIASSEKEYSKAVNAFARALAIEPDEERSRRGMTAALQALGKPEEARRYELR